MNIAIISRGKLERVDKRLNTIEGILTCRNSLINNIEKPLIKSGHSVSHLAISYYDDSEWMSKSKNINQKRKDFLSFYDQVYLHTFNINQPALFSKIFDESVFNLSGFDALIILRFDCLFKENSFWLNFGKKDCDLLLPWIEHGDRPNNRRLPDTIHIIYNPAHNIKKMQKALSLKFHQNGMHFIHKVLKSQNIKTDTILKDSYGTGGPNPFYNFLSEER